jgi:hypothetical protein
MLTCTNRQLAEKAGSVFLPVNAFWVYQNEVNEVIIASFAGLVKGELQNKGQNSEQLIEPQAYQNAHDNAHKHLKGRVTYQLIKALLLIKGSL